MSDDKFQWSFIGVIILALVLVIVAAVGAVPGWVIAIAIIGGIIGDGVLLYYWGKDYMSRV